MFPGVIMKRSLLITLLTMLLMATSTYAFDGQRKGFILGGGLGVGPFADVSIDNSDEDDSHAGVAFNLLVGYAWDEQNMIVYLLDAIHYSEDTDFWLGYDAATQGFGGIGYFHYFGPTGKSAYICGGLGLQYWEPSGWDWGIFDSRPDPEAGFGILIGGGYEFTRHLQVYSSLSFGRTSEGDDDYNHTQFLITISAVAF